MLNLDKAAELNKKKEKNVEEIKINIKNNKEIYPQGNTNQFNGKKLDNKKEALLSEVHKNETAKYLSKINIENEHGESVRYYNSINLNI